MENNSKYLPKFRTGAKSLKEFYSLNKEEKETYIKELLLIPESDRGDVDSYLIRFYTNIEPANKHFISINE